MSRHNTNTHQRTPSQLSEDYIQDSFHSYLKSSLMQAKAERLLDVEVLASAEGDLMITGPALCLYFAALRCTTNPPSVPLPRSSKSSSSSSSSPRQPTDLSYDNCPPAFVSFLRVWAAAVPSIQSLPPESQHDLARLICGLPPLQPPQTHTNADGHMPAITGIAADLRAVAIEISQRRSFQDRYAADLQAALDAGAGPASASPRKASFVPPPVYDASPAPSPRASPRNSVEALPPVPPSRGSHSHSHNHSHSPPLSPGLLSPYASSSSSSNTHTHTRPRTSSTTSFSSASTHASTTTTILTPSSPAIDFIRETLYASLGDALSQYPSLRSLLRQRSDRPRAYFAAVAFAILDVASRSITPSGAVRGVLGTELTLDACPAGLRPFMAELASIGREARAIEEEDNERAMELAVRGEDIPVPRMERVRMVLEEGVGYEYARAGERGEGRRRSVEGRAVAFANRINALSLGMTRLPAFRERQEDVFAVLAGVGG